MPAATLTEEGQIVIPAEITLLLRRTADGDAAARDALYDALYHSLSRLARSQLASAGTISLDAPAILHEAFMRMQKAMPTGEHVNRRIFFTYASRVMRSVIVDYVRERQAAKRGGGDGDVTLRTGLEAEGFSGGRILELNEALQRLALLDPRCHQVVEMRYFGGMTEEEIAEALAVSLPTVKRDWRKARAFLFEALRERQ